MTKIRIKESDVQRQILSYLSCVPKDVPMFWRQNTGAMVIKGKTKDRFIRFGEKGISDILGILADGRMLAIEVKSPQRKNVVSMWQRDFLDRVNKAGGVAMVVSSVEEVIDNIKKISKEKR